MRLHFEVEGTGYPLIILHGLLGWCENWRAQRKAFSQSYQVFALDLRNHGRSPHSEIFNLEVMAEDLREFIDEHALGSAHLLGHSLGGRIMMQFANSYPEKASKLVIVDIAAKAYEGEHWDILEALQALDVKQFKSRAEVDAALAPKIPAPSMRRFLLKNLERDGDHGIKWRINLNAIYRNYHHTIKALALSRRFEKPTLFIRGEKSQYIEEKDIPAIKDSFPCAEVVTIAGAAHWVHVDAPEQFHRVVISFLGRN